MRLSALMLFALTACSDGSTDDTDVTEDSGTTEDSGSEDTGTAPTCNFGSEDPNGTDGVQLSGVIRDASGNPLEDAEIGLCKSVCRSLCTDANGAFSYTFVPDDTYSFHVAPPHGADDLVELVWPLTFSGTATTQDVTLPALPAMTTLPSTPTEVEVATGLFVTVGQGDLGVIFEPDPTDIGAAAMTSAQFPLPAGTFVAGWYMEPYDARADAGLPLRFATPNGVTAGTTLHAYMSSYDDFGWLDLGTFTESGGFLTADNTTAGKITVLGTLVLVDEN
ncbi:MAG: carboxypeptidase regulatory-like domain-containing protein [Deltaproteobacteria bacterium]|nr:MAG: carboxypeptidase regulatory-like domain-containing protein [Deltaproteobacteria bacterium]